MSATGQQEERQPGSGQRETGCLQPPKQEKDRFHACYRASEFERQHKGPPGTNANRDLEAAQFEAKGPVLNLSRGRDAEELRPAVRGPNCRPREETGDYFFLKRSPMLLASFNVFVAICEAFLTASLAVLPKSPTPC